MVSFRTTLPAFLLLTCSLITGSCDSRRFFEENKSIAGGVWNTRDKLLFEVNIRDTVSLFNIFLNVRNSGDYPYSNLYFFIHTRFPAGKVTGDTMECQLADYDGKWLGSGIGSVKFNRFLFQQGVRFRHPGTYVFEVEQAMREDPLKGIRDVGIRIEKQQS
ncbi:MAG TPA: gliding motility lipoprotein GldH [Bacteroidales bacterium]|nr:gliding motility lipoprotein GldH [Bacteroidales bacterium]